MKNMLLGFCLMLALAPITSRAAEPEFTNISQSDLENILNDFAGVFAHTPVNGASSLGKIFGIELGLIAGMTDTPEVEKLVKEADPTKTIDQLPNAGIFASISVPFGITVEAAFLPEKELDDVDLKYTAFGVKWTINEVGVDLPVDVALRASQTTSSLGFIQDVSGTPANVTIENDITEVGAVVSKKFLILEPYAGISYLKSSGDVTISGTNTFFDFTASQSASSDISGNRLYAGLNVNLLLINIGAEVGKVFDNTKFSAKVSFKF